MSRDWCHDRCSTVSRGVWPTPLAGLSSGPRRAVDSSRPRGRHRGRAGWASVRPAADEASRQGRTKGPVRAGPPAVGRSTAAPAVDAEHVHARVVAREQGPDGDRNRIGGIATGVDPLRQLVGRRERCLEGGRVARLRPSRSAARRHRRSACPSRRGASRAATAVPGPRAQRRRVAWRRSAGHSPWGDTGRPPRARRRPASAGPRALARTCRPSPAIPGAGSHGVVMHSMVRFGSPVIWRMAPSHPELDQPGQRAEHRIRAA